MKLRFLIVILGSFSLIGQTQKYEPNCQINDPLISVLDAIFAPESKDQSTPPEVPETILPIKKSYAINTRIIIEGKASVFPQENQPDVSAVWWAIGLKKVKQQLKNAEKIYNKTGIKFVVSEIIYKEQQSTILKHWVEAHSHENALTIIYMLPNDFPYEGYSSPPWDGLNRGILISYYSDEWTLAHEIGHFFGLLHTFETETSDNDLLADTPPQKNKYCENEKSVNCGNIMNYCPHSPKKITDQQLERFSRFLRAKRGNLFTTPRPDFLLLADDNSLDKIILIP